MNGLRRHLPVVTVALLALVATITSLGHDFTYDDKYVVFSNGRVHSLAGMLRLWGQPYWPPALGGDGYRPIVMSLFTLQWVAGGGAPWVFHLGNILLAVGAALAVRWCVAAVLPERGAWVAAALFAVHPLHVEVTGNVVGQSELVVAICLALAVGIYLRGRRTGLLPARHAAAILALYAIALFTKEHAIVLPGLLAAAELTVIDHDDWRARLRGDRPLALALIAVSLLYLLVRAHVQTNFTGFEPFPVWRFLNLSTFDRIATMMTEIPRIGRLLVFPTRLSGDYSPADVTIAHGPQLIELPGVMICVGISALAVALRRRAPVMSFGLLWVIISFLPVSNLLLPAGFIVAERTLFFPSIGVAIVGGDIVRRIMAGYTSTEWQWRACVGAVALLLLLGAARSIDRQRVWKNNDSFTASLVRDSPNGYRAHFIRGRQQGLEMGNFPQMEIEYRRALRLFPYDASMTLTMADGYTRAGRCKPAAALFKWTYAVEPLTGQGRYEYVWCLAKLGRWQEVRTEALAGMSLVEGKELTLMRRALAIADSSLGRGRPRGSVTAPLQSARRVAEHTTPGAVVQGGRTR